MTRKDYIAIANIIIKTEAYHNQNFIVELMDMFYADNSNFDESRFINYINDNVLEVENNG